MGRSQQARDKLWVKRAPAGGMRRRKAYETTVVREKKTWIINVQWKAKDTDKSPEK